MSDAPAFCPHCGYNLKADAPLVSGDWRITPHGLSFKGRPIPLTAYQAIIVHSIASARGRPVKWTALAERIDSDTDTNSTQVLLHRARRAAPGIPIRTIYRAGYVWDAPVQEAA